MLWNKRGVKENSNDPSSNVFRSSRGALKARIYYRHGEKGKLFVQRPCLCLLSAPFLSLSLSLSPSVCLLLPFSFFVSTQLRRHAFYPEHRGRKKERSSVKSNCLELGALLELCYLFFSILKAWWACFQHLPTCPSKGRREAERKAGDGVRGRETRAKLS